MRDSRTRGWRHSSQPWCSHYSRGAGWSASGGCWRPVAVFVWLMRGTRASSARGTWRCAAWRSTSAVWRRLEDRWAGTGEPGERFRDDRHVYANDLDLFGRGSLVRAAVAGAHADRRGHARRMADGAGKSGRDSCAAGGGRRARPEARSSRAARAGGRRRRGERRYRSPPRVGRVADAAATGAARGRLVLHRGHARRHRLISRSRRCGGRWQPCWCCTRSCFAGFAIEIERDRLDERAGHRPPISSPTR